MDCFGRDPLSRLALFTWMCAVTYVALNVIEYFTKGL